MNQTDKVVSLEWAQKLVDAGIVLDTEFCWIQDVSGWHLISKYIKEVSTFCQNNNSIPAPLACELKDYLYKKLTTHDNFFPYVMTAKSPCCTGDTPEEANASRGWQCWINKDRLKCEKLINEDTEANACAAMAVKLQNKEPSHEKDCQTF